MLVASLAVQQVQEVGAVTTQEEVMTECKIQIYVILAFNVTIFGLVMCAMLQLPIVCYTYQLYSV